ncbi:MAG: tetratricopeptide repeat protein [Lyngbya sp. HA4199-MV5]|jgi:tetratricopeptide (TPR) repeat protein|nr:tetratricopeptide repeat protein [Lyngbya sp. HA4199-MV5]
MTSLLYPLLLVVLIYAFPYFIVYLRTRQTTFPYARFQRQDIEAVPDHLKETLQPAIVALETLGFQFCDYYQTERTEGNHVWHVLLRHEACQTYAGVEVQQPYNTAAPFNFGFSTFFADGTRFMTGNNKLYGFFSDNPQDILQAIEDASLETLWQAHKDKLAALSQTKTPLNLTPDGFVETFEAHERENINRLAKAGEVHLVEDDRGYRLTNWVAFTAVLKVARGRYKRSSKKQAGQQDAGATLTTDAAIALDLAEFQRLEGQPKGLFSRKAKVWLLLGSLALFAVSYTQLFNWETLLILLGAILFHEGGHLVAMKLSGYQDTTVFFVPFLGALATARNDDATLTQKFWVSLAGPLPGLVLGIGLAILIGDHALSGSDANAYPDWVHTTSMILISLNLFNLLPVYPLDGGQIANLLLFSRHPYLAVVFQSIGVLLLMLLGLGQPPFLVFAALIALTIPTSFRVAKLRKQLASVPVGDRDQLLHAIFALLQQNDFGAKPFAKRYGLALSLVESHRETKAKRRTRAGLAGLYLLTLLGGIIGTLYAFIPNFTALVSMASYYVQNPRQAHQQRLKQDIERADKALSVNPKDVDAYLQRGKAHWRLDEKAAATQDYDQAVRLDSKNTQAHLERARFRVHLDDYQGAIADYTEVLRLDSHNSEVYFSRAGVYLALKNQQKALQDYDQVLRLDPQNIRAYLSRGYAHQAVKNYRSAIADFNQILRLDPQNLSAYFARADALYELKDYKGAIADANQIIQQDPNFSEAYQLRGKIRSKMGDSQGAIADRQKAKAIEDTQLD